MQNSSSLPQMEDPNALARHLLQRAHNQDGLPEIAMGGTFLLVSALQYAQFALAHGSIGFKTAVVTEAVLMPVLILGTPATLRWARGRYLMARVGYVKHKPIGRKQIGLGLMVAVLMAVALFVAATRASRPDGWILAGTGLFGGALAALGGRLPRFVIGGALSAAMGMLLATSGVSLDLGFAILFGFWAAMSLTSGGLAFARFMRQPVENGE